jgi:phage terminase large subunit GpA-like protein
VRTDDQQTDYPSAEQAERIRGLTREWQQLWLPPKRLSLSQWAEQRFVLSREYSSISGLLELYEFQREPFDAFTDPRVQKIVLKVGTQMLKTLLIQAALAYIIAEQPGPTLLLQPKENDAETFSKERLDPMFRDCDLPVRSSTILFKEFPNGSLTLAGAIAPGNMARRSIQYLFGDEVNKYPVSAGNEGDPISLADKRTMTFGTRAKRILACSPTVPTGKISREYDASDQRKPWIPCPKCGEFQILTWPQVKWNNKLPKHERAATAHYECEHCGAEWNDGQRYSAVKQVQWRAEAPFRGTAGFWISHLYSPLKTLGQIVDEYLDTKDDPNESKVFTNTTLAEDYIEKGEAPAWKRLYERREYYPIGVVPEGGLLLTAAVDIQANRFEFEVKAWAPDRQSWSVYYEVIPIPTDADKNPLPSMAWKRLAELIARTWPTAEGGSMQVMTVSIDTGFNPDPAYRFCARYPQPAHSPTGSRVHSYRTVVPIKGGHSSFKLIEKVSDVDAARKRNGLRIVTVGVSYAKQQIYDRLRLPGPMGEEPYPDGYCHHPDYSQEYFEGLCAETRVAKEKGGFEWRKDGRNEPLDLAVYNELAAVLSGRDIFTAAHWDELARRRRDSAKPAEELPNPGPKRGPNVRFRMDV